MLLPRHQNAGQDHDIKIAKRCSENVARFRYLGATVTNQNLIQKEIEFG
jgi:ribosomal protein S2